MSDLYDALNNQIPKQSIIQQSRMSKEDYAKYMKDKRTTLFNMANEQTMNVVQSPESFLNFLDMQARMDYTVTNTLLVMSQNPQATLLKDFNHWKELKASIKKGSKGIEILEPYGEYTRQDGSIGTRYNPKIVFDVSQIVKGDHFINNQVEYTPSELVSAIIYKSDVKPEVVSQESKLPTDVFFEEGSQTVFVKENQNPFDMINGLLREYAFVEYYQNGITRNEATFLAESVGYLLSQKYHVKNYNKDFAQECLNHFSDMDQFTTKKELESINSISNQINDRMEHALYALQQAHQEKQVKKNEYIR